MTSPYFDKLAGRAVKGNVVPVDNDVLYWKSSSSVWQPRAGHFAYLKVTAIANVVSSANEGNLVSATVTGGDLAASGRMRLTLEGDCLYNNDAANTLTLRLKYGGTYIATAAFILSGGLSASRRAWKIVAELSNLGVTNSQYVSMTLLLSRPNDAATGTGATATESSVWVGTAAEDSTANLTLAVTAQWNAASANNSFRMFAANVEVL